MEIDGNVVGVVALNLGVSVAANWIFHRYLRRRERQAATEQETWRQANDEYARSLSAITRDETLHVLKAIDAIRLRLNALTGGLVCLLGITMGTIALGGGWISIREGARWGWLSVLAGAGLILVGLLPLFLLEKDFAIRIARTDGQVEKALARRLESTTGASVARSEPAGPSEPPS
jgi:hypothetical protein